MGKPSEAEQQNHGLAVGVLTVFSLLQGAEEVGKFLVFLRRGFRTTVQSSSQEIRSRFRGAATPIESPFEVLAGEESPMGCWNAICLFFSTCLDQDWEGNDEMGEVWGIYTGIQVVD